MAIKMAILFSASILLIFYLIYVPKWWKSPLALTVIIYTGLIFISHQYYLYTSALIVIALHLLMVYSIISVQEKAYSRHKKTSQKIGEFNNETTSS